MNTYNITLSSNASNYSQILSTLHFDDYSKLSISLDNLFDGSVPIYMMIDWGDGVSESFDNSIESSRTHATVFTTNDLLNLIYTHDYYPSSITLYKQLSAQILITYMNGGVSFFVIPIQIRTYDYFESIYDIHLEHTNILPLENNQKEHYFSTVKDGYLIELRGN